jgi:hypothetical protein
VLLPESEAPKHLVLRTKVLEGGISEVHTVRRAPAPYREGTRRRITMLKIRQTRRSEGVMRFIVGILWSILMALIILVVLNIPGVR